MDKVAEESCLRYKICLIQMFTIWMGLSSMHVYKEFIFGPMAVDGNKKWLVGFLFWFAYAIYNTLGLNI